MTLWWTAPDKRRWNLESFQTVYAGPEDDTAASFGIIGAQVGGADITVLAGGFATLDEAQAFMDSPRGVFGSGVEGINHG